MATALLSLAKGKAPKRQFAMTGELTLTGQVLPIGGVKEKVLAARRAGIKAVVLPERNRKDLADVPAEAATTHGVYVLNERGRLRAYLHKPSVAEMADWQAVEDATKQYGGEELAVELTPQAEAQLAALAENEEVADAVEELGVPLEEDTHNWYGEPAKATRQEFYRQARLMKLDDLRHKPDVEPLSDRLWRRYGRRAFEMLDEIRFPHSLGLLYSAFTYFIGFKVNAGEYKLMGLAPYGEAKYKKEILEHLMDLREDGSFRLDMSYFNYCQGLTMTSRRFHDLFGGPPRRPEAPITQREMDIARSIQSVTEEVVLKIARNVHRELGVDWLCLAGGVALNCVANGRLLREGPYKDIWVQPAAGDAGGALGAALSVWHEYLENPRAVNGSDAMQGAYLGPRYDDSSIRARLDSVHAVYEVLDDAALMPRLADILAAENVVGWFQGRMEFGPRALGGRSILGDPRSQKMQSVMNLKIKYRESFRPFAPAVLADRVSDWFELDRRSPYMLLVAPVKREKCCPMTEQQQQLFGIDKLNIPRSEIPAVTHVDYSARVQTVHRETNPRFHALLEAFQHKTGCPVLVNTSFNVRGEPIVCTPEDAYRCFMRTEMDYLVMENVIISKADQPEWNEEGDWRDEFALD